MDGEREHIEVRVSHAGVPEAAHTWDAPDDEAAFREEVFRVFIGEKHPVMLPRVLSCAPFNVFALLFGPPYYAYRKLPVPSLVLWGVTTALSLLKYLIKSNCTTFEQADFVNAVFAVAFLVLSLAQAVLFYRIYGANLQKRYEEFSGRYPRDVAVRRIALRDLAKTYDPTSIVALLSMVVLTLAVGFGLNVLDDASVSQLVRGMG